MTPNRSATIDSKAISSLHPSEIADSIRIRRLLRKARAQDVEFRRGLNLRLDREIARISGLTADSILLETSGFRRKDRRQIFLSFELENRRYFFATEPISAYRGNLLEVQIPRSIFSTERRDQIRNLRRHEGSTIRLRTESGESIQATLLDESPGGLGLHIRSEIWRSNWRTVQVEPDDSSSGARSFSVKSVSPSTEPGWTRIGLSKFSNPEGASVKMQRWSTIPTSFKSSAPLPDPCPETSGPPAELVYFQDELGQGITGFLDRNSFDGPRTAIILQTGWGETKEALLPLARTIVETFSRYREPVATLRIDGVNQRGESQRDAQCRTPGREYNNFGFSQPIRDLRASRDFLAKELSPRRTILVSRSISALAARKFVAQDQGRTVDGWISVCGVSDLQSATRAISGGVDFAIGRERGVELGYQELLGVTIHADRITEDAAEAGLLYIDDARDDFSKITVPVSWYHGEFDAWVDANRVEDIMSFGDLSNREIVYLPVSHRQGWSNSAFLVYELVARRIAAIALGREFEPTRPTSADLSKRRSRERDRRPKVEINLRSFWRDYLVGPDNSAGFELMTASNSYADLMTVQIEQLQLRSDDRVMDLGCGTGALATTLAADPKNPGGLHITGVDFVPDAMNRARARLQSLDTSVNMNVSFAGANLDVVEGALMVPFASETFDCILASLFLSYVERPPALLAEAYRLLRPGGRIVVSSLLKDADISSLYADSLAELQASGATDQIPEMVGKSLHNSARTFLNDASRILDLESDGAFTFWDSQELRKLLGAAGFSALQCTFSFGSPAQAVVISGQKPA